MNYPDISNIAASFAYHLRGSSRNALMRRGAPSRCAVIPGWPEGPDLRCAIAHRGISMWLGYARQSRDSGFDAPRRPGMTDVRSRRARLLAQLAIIDIADRDRPPGDRAA